jgi:uncharacterized repeat protein (TIGR01451 family)
MVGILTQYETGQRNADGSFKTESIRQYAAINVRRPPAPTPTPTPGPNQPQAQARLTSSTVSPIVLFGAGQSGTISLTITNNGSRTATNIVIQGDAPQGLVPVTASARTVQELRAGQSVTLEFSYMPTAEARAQTYMIEFKIDYENGITLDNGTRAKGQISQFGSINSNVAGTSISGQLASLSSTVESDTRRAGVAENSVINLTVTNSGPGTASNIVVTGTPPQGIAPSSANVQIIPELAAGESKTLRFMFMPTPEATTRTYMVSFNVSFENGLTAANGSRITDSFMQYGTVNASISTAESLTTRGVPRLILSEYRITSTNEENPRVVLAGQEFDMFMRVKNTHPSRTVSNIIVSLSMPESGTGQAASNVFSPVSGSNSFYIARIPPGGEVDVNLRMFCLNNAQGRNYVMRVNFMYEDDEGTQLTGVQEVGITVRQPDKMELGPINFPSFMGIGDSHFLSFYFRNTGYVTLRNLKITTEGEGFDHSGGTYIVGNFSMGGFEYYDGSVRATEPGEHTLQIVVSYDLDTGEHVRHVEEAVVTVSDGFGMDDGGWGLDSGMGGFGGRPGSGGVMVVSGGGGVITSVGGTGMSRPGQGQGFDGGWNQWEETGSSSFGEFIGKVSDWFKGAFDYANANIWPWIVICLVIIVIIVVLAVRKRKMRRAFTLED